LSNQSTQEAWFDNMNVALSNGMLLEEHHYYAYGLPIAGFSSLAANATPNRQRYQGNEYIESAGLEWMDFHNRQYDPQLGRFLSVDPLADAGGQQVLSPYHAMGCNPVSMVDPLGLQAGLAPGTKLLNFMPPNAGIAYVEGQRVVLGGAMTFNFAGDYASHQEFYAQWVKEGAGEYEKASNRGYGQGTTLQDALLNGEIGPNDYISYISPTGNNVYVTDVDGKDIIYSLDVSSENQQHNYDGKVLHGGLTMGGFSLGDIGNIDAGAGYLAGALGSNLAKALARNYNGANPMSVIRLPSLIPYNIRVPSKLLRVGVTVLKRTGFLAGLAGLGITYKQYSNNEITATEALVDGAFGVTGFVGARGALISISYFGIKAIYEYSTGNSVFEKPGGVK